MQMVTIDDKRKTSFKVLVFFSFPMKINTNRYVVKPEFSFVGIRRKKFKTIGSRPKDIAIL